MALPTLSGIAKEAGKRTVNTVTTPVKNVANEAVRPIREYTDPIAQFFKDASKGDKDSDAVKKTASNTSMSNDKLDLILNTMQQAVSLLSDLVAGQDAAAKKRAEEAKLAAREGSVDKRDAKKIIGTNKGQDAVRVDGDKKGLMDSLKGLSEEALKLLGITAAISGALTLIKKVLRPLAIAFSVIAATFSGLVSTVAITFALVRRDISNLNRSQKRFLVRVRGMFRSLGTFLKNFGTRFAILLPLIKSPLGLLLGKFALLGAALKGISMLLGFDSVMDMVRMSIAYVSDALAAFGRGIRNFGTRLLNLLPGNNIELETPGESYVDRERKRQTDARAKRKQDEDVVDTQPDAVPSDETTDTNVAKPVDRFAMAASDMKAIAEGIDAIKKPAPDASLTSTPPTIQRRDISGTIDRSDPRYQEILKTKKFTSIQENKSAADLEYRNKYMSKPVTGDKQTGVDVNENTKAAMSASINNITYITNNNQSGSINTTNQVSGLGGPAGIKSVLV